MHRDEPDAVTGFNRLAALCTPGRGSFASSPSRLSYTKAASVRSCLPRTALSRCDRRELPDTADCNEHGLCTAATETASDAQEDCARRIAAGVGQMHSVDGGAGRSTRLSRDARATSPACARRRGHWGQDNKDCHASSAARRARVPAEDRFCARRVKCRDSAPAALGHCDARALHARQIDCARRLSVTQAGLQSLGGDWALQLQGRRMSSLGPMCAGRGGACVAGPTPTVLRAVCREIRYCSMQDVRCGLTSRRLLHTNAQLSPGGQLRGGGCDELRDCQ